MVPFVNPANDAPGVQIGHAPGASSAKISFTYLRTYSNILMTCWLSGERSLPFGLLVSLLAHLSRRLRGELIVYQSSRRPLVRRCVNTFKHEYLRNQWANCNQILSEASLGWGKGCVMFSARSDWNSGFHGNG